MTIPDDSTMGEGCPSCGITGFLAVLGLLVLSYLMVAGVVWVIEWIWRVM
jgi:hypothetical protein